MIFSSTALNKEILKKKGTISFRVSDLFNTAMFQSETFTPTFNSSGVYRRSMPSFNLSFTYRINQKDNQQRRRSRGGNNGDGSDFGF
jgi:hypothetical protein